MPICNLCTRCLSRQVTFQAAKVAAERSNGSQSGELYKAGAQARSCRNPGAGHTHHSSPSTSGWSPGSVMLMLCRNCSPLAAPLALAVLVNEQGEAALLTRPCQQHATSAQMAAALLASVVSSTLLACPAAWLVRPCGTCQALVQAVPAPLAAVHRTLLFALAND